MTDETKTIELTTEAMLITTNDGAGLRLCLPKGADEDGQMPPMVQFLSAIFLRANDPEWVGEQMQWIQDKVEARKPAAN